MTDEDGLFMRVRWFGSSWGAALNDECEHVEVPSGTKCMQCSQAITSRDRGVITACSPNIWGSWWLQGGENEYSVCSYHLSCWMRVVVGEEVTGEILARTRGHVARKSLNVFRFDDEEEDEVIRPGGWNRT